MGPLLLGDLASREYRFLTDREANRLRELVEDRVARVERPELDASGKPARWKPPTAPAPPRPPKPERSGRGPKSQRSERGSRSQRRHLPPRSRQRSRRGAGSRSGRPTSPSTQEISVGRGTSATHGFSKPVRPDQADQVRPGRRSIEAPPVETVGQKSAAAVPTGDRVLSDPRPGKASRNGRGSTVRRSGPGQKSQQNRRGGPSASRPRPRGPARKSRPSTRRRA